MNDEMKSIRAIQKCMEDLGLDISESPSFEIQTEIINLDTQDFGEITVTFKSNWHSGDGPYILINDTIRSFGITYTEFKPRWQRFEYSEHDKTLFVSGENYSFTLRFDT